MTLLEKLFNKEIPLQWAQIIPKPSHSVKAKRILFKAIVYFLLTLGAIFVSIPLLWMISSSLKGPGEVFSYPPKILPIPPHFGNYARALTSEPFFRFAFNTAIITLLNIIGGVLSSTLVGFAFSRLRWKGRDILFLVCLATMMLPYQVTMIPQYAIFNYLKWVDTFYPLFVPAFFGVPFLIFLCRQFFTTIPRELDDAARIDGCNWFDIYWRIILPQAVPVLATCAIFLFNWNWNDFLGPLIYLNTKEKLTLTIGLSFFQSGTYGNGTDWQFLMAAAVFSVAPVIILFFFAQRYFIQGIVFTGLKG